MIFLGIILLVALMIPIMGIVIDSPIGRALGRRIEGPEQVVPAPMADLIRRLEVVESEVEEMNNPGAPAAGGESVPPAPAGRPAQATLAATRRVAGYR